MVQCGSVTQGFFGGVIGLPITIHVLKQLVGGGDDVLDFRAVFGFQQRNSVDEHRLVGDQLGGLFQLGQCNAGRNAGTQHNFAF
jgi:hypothetical protein